MTKKTVRSIFIISVLACAEFSFFFFSTPQKAQTPVPYVVRNTSDTVVAGACGEITSTAGCSLRGAIQAANANANNSGITFAIPASDPFCSAGVCTINLTQALPNITTSVSINGPGPDKLIVKPATGVDITVFTISTPSTVSIFGLTISNGRNGLVSAGGVGTVNVTTCVISGNHGSSFGGGIYNVSGVMNLRNSTITGNTASFRGSGIFSESSGSTLNIINSTISGNTGAPAGGGIGNSGGTVNLTNSTVSNNSAGIAGGIFNESGTVNVKNSIIAQNVGAAASPDVIGNFVSAGFNLIGKRDGSTGFTAPTDMTGTIAAPLDPMLDPAGLQNNGGLTMTIRLLAESPAIDKATSNGLTGNLTTDQRTLAFRRTFDNPLIPNAAGGNGTDIGAFEIGPRTPFDFDGDGKTDVGIIRDAASKEWWVLRSLGGVFAAPFGTVTDILAPADFTGDGKTDVAVFRPSDGFWYVLRSEDLTFYGFPFGTNGDVPAPGDFDGDGKADATVFRPSSGTWFQLLSGGGTAAVQFGAAGDKPVVADYDGDGKSDVAVFRPLGGSGSAEWWLLRSTAGLFGAGFGNASDKAVQGDYTGDGKTDIAFWRPSDGFWYILRSEDFLFYAFPWGTNGDIPAPGDYDGDGKHDAAIFRSGIWHINRSTSGHLATQFGATGDRPIPNAFVP